MDLDDRLVEALMSKDGDVVVEVGNGLFDVGRFDDAARCFRHAIDLGAQWALINLGNALGEAGRMLEAIDAFERATAAGDNDAWLNLGIALEAEGDLASALVAYRTGSGAGDAQASLLAAFLLIEIDEPDQAETLAALSKDQGSLPAVGMLAHWRYQQSLDPSLEADLRAGADHYEPARVSLADLLSTTGRFREAADVLTAGTMRDEYGCFLPLGNLYADHLEQPDLAEQAYLAGIAAGDAHCHHNLAVLLHDQDRHAEARVHDQLGAAAGDALAAHALIDDADEEEDDDDDDEDAW